MNELNFKYKLGSFVEYCGLLGIIYKIKNDIICVCFPNVSKDLYKHKYLEFSLSGKLNEWQVEPSIHPVDLYGMDIDIKKDK